MTELNTHLWLKKKKTKKQNSPESRHRRNIPQHAAAAPAKLLQSCPTLCDPIDSSPPGSPVPGILLARTLEWVAISFSNVWKWKAKVKWLSCVCLLVTPWTAAYQPPPSMGFSRQECWSGLPLPSPTHQSKTQFSPQSVLLIGKSAQASYPQPSEGRQKK